VQGNHRQGLFFVKRELTGINGVMMGDGIGLGIDFFGGCGAGESTGVWECGGMGMNENRITSTKILKYMYNNMLY
jgi:hypothetical protein